MSAESFMRPGAVDLSGLRARAQAPAGQPAGNGSGVVIEVTEATFQTDVLQRSMSVPVVIDFWAEWCGPCKQLSPTLDKLAGEYDGRFVLAKIDVDSNQQLAASAQVQSIPMVLGVVKGQAVPLFAGALPEAQVRQYLDKLLEVAAANGVSGRVDTAAGAAAGEPAGDTPYDAAYEALERGEFDAAAKVYQEMLDRAPGDAEAQAGLAQVELLRRNQDVDPSAAVSAADQNPADLDAAFRAADVELLSGQPEQAFSRLIALVRQLSGDERERARFRLIELFEVVGSSDPRVIKARAALASALF